MEQSAELDRLMLRLPTKLTLESPDGRNTFDELQSIQLHGQVVRLGQREAQAVLLRFAWLNELR